jgi:predicted nucleic acid-binding protein
MARIILDANVVISALIKDSFTRRFITKSDHEFWFPEQAFDRIEKYKELIIKKSGLSSEVINSIFESLFIRVNIVPKSRSDAKLPKAKEVMGPIDKEDALFVACALSMIDAIIWSDDKHLKKQNLVKVYTTKEILKI